MRQLSAGNICKCQSQSLNTEKNSLDSSFPNILKQNFFLFCIIDYSAVVACTQKEAVVSKLKNQQI